MPTNQQDKDDQHTSKMCKEWKPKVHRIVNPNGQ